MCEEGGDIPKREGVAVQRWKSSFLKKLFLKKEDLNISF